MDVRRRSAQKRKLAIAARQAKRGWPARLPAMWALSDPQRDINASSLAAGLPEEWGLICRHFGAVEHIRDAAEAVAVARRRGIIVLIAADPRLALVTGADGVHWPERLRHKAPRWRSAFRVMTTSAHSPAALRAANGVDAVLLSAVFPSNSSSAGAPMGPLRYRQLARTSALPVIALGGVNPQTARQVSDYGGIACVDAVARLYCLTDGGN